MKKPLVIITGPTAAGKTDLSISLAHRANAEIISADSVQVYQDLNVGSAKIMPEEMQGVPHHMIDIFPPEHDFNVSEFAELASQSADEILSRGHLPLVVGGTGFYIQALLYGINFQEEVDDGTRARLEEKARTEEGKDALYEELLRIDPKSCQKIHKNNVKRVIRALEFYHYNHYPISEHNETEHEKESQYNSAYFVLTMDREKLYSRIDRRVDIMMEQGLLEEVKSLYERGLTEKYVSMAGIGYKEILSHLRGECSLEEAVAAIKQNTRHFAKRQLTWFRRERDVIWINKDEYKTEEEILEFMIQVLKERNII